jgi:hypothetical protein
MSQENVERARAAYAAMNEGYKTGDFGTLRRIMEETCAPECKLEAGSGDVFTEGEWSGIDGLLSILTGQMEALEEVWVSPRTSWTRETAASSCRSDGAGALATAVSHSSTRPLMSTRPGRERPSEYRSSGARGRPSNPWGSASRRAAKSPQERGSGSHETIFHLCWK